MSTLSEIEKQTQLYENRRQKLAAVIQQMNNELEYIKKQFIPQIKRLVGAAAEEKEALRQMIEDAPELFVKPRTLVLHGIKVGFQKQKGTIEITDAGLAVMMIHKHFPDRAEELIKTTEKPNKTALAELTVGELKKLGITVEETGDAVIIKATDSDVDKLVAALLKENEMNGE